MNPAAGKTIHDVNTQLLLTITSEELMNLLTYLKKQEQSQLMRFVWLLDK